MIRTNIINKILAIGLVTAMLTGCGYSGNTHDNPDGGISSKDFINEIDEDYIYKEWADKVGLVEREYYHVTSIGEPEENDGHKTMYIIIAGFDGDNSKEAMEDVASLIEAHNEFVEDNPDYFSDDLDIKIQLIEASQKPIMLINTALEGISNADLDLSLQNDHKFKYVVYDASSYCPDYLSADVSISIPVVKIHYGRLKATDFEDLSKMLDMFVDVEAVIYSLNDSDTDHNERFVELVTEKAPGAGAFTLNANGAIRLID